MSLEAYLRQYGWDVTSSPFVWCENSACTSLHQLSDQDASHAHHRTSDRANRFSKQ